MKNTEVSNGNSLKNFVHMSNIVAYGNGSGNNMEGLLEKQKDGKERECNLKNPGVRQWESIGMEKKGQMEKILVEGHYDKSLGTTLMCRGKEIQSSLEIFIFCKRKNRSTMGRN